MDRVVWEIPSGISRVESGAMVFPDSEIGVASENIRMDEIGPTTAHWTRIIRGTVSYDDGLRKRERRFHFEINYQRSLPLGRVRTRRFSTGDWNSEKTYEPGMDYDWRRMEAERAAPPPESGTGD